MDVTVTVAFIAACGSVVTAMVSFPLTMWRITQLEKKMDKHNGLIERTFRLEEHNKYVDKKLEELEDERKVCKAH